MFFVVSTGRSGTMTIADWLSRSLGCVCPHEPEPRLIPETAQYLSGAISHHKMVDLLRRTRPTQPLAPGQQYGESHHVLSQVIPALREAFPDAKFIWLLRDGRDVVASTYARNWYGGQRAQRSPEARYWEQWRIRGDHVGAMSRRDWLSLSRFEKCCWHWTYKNRLIESQLEATGADAWIIRLENLTEQAEGLFSFLGLPMPDDAPAPHLNKAKVQVGQVPTPWRAWTLEQIQAFEEFCGVSMDDWYPEWRAEANSIWPTPGVRLQWRVRARRGIKRYLNDEMIIVQTWWHTYKFVRHKWLGPLRRAVMNKLARPARTG